MLALSSLVSYQEVTIHDVRRRPAHAVISGTEPHLQRGVIFI